MRSPSFLARWSCLAVAALLLVALPAGAQEDEPTPAPAEEESEDERPTVTEYVFVEGSLSYVPSSSTIVTKLPLERRSTPNNVGVVSEELIRDRYDRVLGEALVQVSNVNVQSQNGVHDFFLIRGFDSLSSGLVLTDGAPEPEATFYQTYNVELVEVLKGPGGFLYGSNPLAGAVNLVRKQPAPSRFVDVSVSAGSHDTYEGSFDWNHGGSEQALQLRLNGLVRDGGSHREGKQARVLALNPTLAWQLGSSARLNVSFEVVDLDVVPDAGVPIVFGELPPVDRDTSYQSALDESDQEVRRFQVDYEWRPSSWLTVRDKLYRRDLDWTSRATFLAGVVPTGPASFGILRTLVGLDDRQDVTGNQLEAVIRFETGELAHSVLAGLELTRHADRFEIDVALLPVVDALDPEEPAEAAPLPLPDQGFAGDSRSLVVAPYVVDQLRIGDRFDLLLGARIDAVDFQEDRLGTERNDTEVSPMVGAVYRPDDTFSIYGSFSRAFAPPSPRVVGERIPERGTQYEGGLKWFAPGLGAQATFAAYHLERDNIPIPDDLGFTQQAGNQRSRGLEIDLSLEPSSRLRAFASYAFNDAELTSFAETVQIAVNPPEFRTVDRSGNRPAFAPRHVANLWVGADVTRRLEAGLGARYVGSQFVAEDNAFALDRVFTLDAAVFYRVADGRIRLHLRNLTDREYFLRGFGAASVIPAAPFSVYVGFDYRM